MSTNMWKGERKQGKVWLKREKQAFNFFQLRYSVNSYNVLQAYIDVYWSFILSFSHVNFWFRGPIGNPQLHSESLRKRFTTESDELSSSECCWKENLQLKVAASTQQPKKNGWTLHFIKNNFFEILKRANH